MYMKHCVYFKTYLNGFQNILRHWLHWWITRCIYKPAKLRSSKQQHKHYSEPSLVHITNSTWFDKEWFKKRWQTSIMPGLCHPIYHSGRVSIHWIKHDTRRPFSKIDCSLCLTQEWVCRRLKERRRTNHMTPMTSELWVLFEKRTSQ